MANTAYAAHVVVDALGFAPGRALGAQTYLISILRALDAHAVTRKISVLCTIAARSVLKREAPRLSYVSSFNVPRLARPQIILEHFCGRGILERIAPDAVFFPLNHCVRVSLPSVLMVHDMAPRFYRTRFPLSSPLRMRAREFLLRRSVLNANHIICPSNFVASELLGSYRISPQRLTVAAEAPGLAVPPAEQREIRLPAKRYCFVAPAFQAPHKDLATAVRGFAALRQVAPKIFDNASLLLVGNQGPSTKACRHLAGKLQIAGSVYFTGRIADAQLWWLYSHVDALIFPSLYEGCGLPILEAQQSGLPAIVADVPAARETSEGHAWFFPPGDALTLACQIVRVLNDPYDRERIVARARQSARSHSWVDHVETVLNACDRAVVR